MERTAGPVPDLEASTRTPLGYSGAFVGLRRQCQSHHRLPSGCTLIDPDCCSTSGGSQNPRHSGLRKVEASYSQLFGALLGCGHLRTTFTTRASPIFGASGLFGSMLESIGQASPGPHGDTGQSQVFEASISST